MVNTIIEGHAVTKYFGTLCAVDGIDLNIHAGELFGLIGHNGAGKSTLFKMMLGLLPLSSGEIYIGGERVGGRNFRNLQRQIGYLPENLALYENLTGIETLQFFAKLKGVSTKQCNHQLERVGLINAAKRRVNEYSKGMRQRLGFAQMLLGDPKLLFLDEPTNGLDPEAIREFFAILHKLKTEGVTIVLTSHILADIQERVDRLAIMKNGKIQKCGSLQALRESVNLPLLLEIDGNLTLDQIMNALADLQIISVEMKHNRFWIKLPAEIKMLVLTRLVAMGDATRNLNIHEPSLEDLFFELPK